MQPLLEMTVVRAWHWGIAIVGLPHADVPEIDPSKRVSIGSGSLVMLVRHAQDIDSEKFEDDWDWATPTIHVRSLVEAEAVDRIVVGEVIFETGDERISIGDADGEIVFPTPAVRTRVVVSTTDESDPMNEVWIDLLPADD